MMGCSYDVLKEYPVQTILDLVDGTGKLEIDGMVIPVDKEKMLSFKNSIKCLTCDVHATHFSLEKIKNCSHGIYGKYHFNLYGKLMDNTPVMMTVDHIILAKNKGRHHHSNFNTMCTKCNARRADKFPNLEDFIKFSEENPIGQYLAEMRKRKKERELFKKTVHDTHVRSYYINRNKKLA